VALITQDRLIPFIYGIPSHGWLCWFRKHHPELSLRLAQGLDAKREHSLCPNNVKMFYSNLQSLYDKYEYSPSKIWNCNESGIQVNQNGRTYVLARQGCRNVHQGCIYNMMSQL
jgi:hypothetical protein